MISSFINVIDINIILLYYIIYSIGKYIKKLLGMPGYILKRELFNLCYI